MRIGIVFLVLMCLFACKERKGAKREVSVSILPQRYFVERVAGDYVHVNVMVPPGANPAVMNLTTEQLKALSKSSVYFAIGYLPFELANLYPVLEDRKDILLVKHTEGMELIKEGVGDKHEHGMGVNPHVWMSPVYVRQMVSVIRDVLIKKFPEQREAFVKNHDRFVAEIDSLDRKARCIIGKKEHRIFLIYHPALTYFAREYGMEEISIEDEGKEPHPAHIRFLIDICRKKGIRIVFVQHQFDETNARAVASEIGGEIIEIDPLNENWKEEMISLLEIIDKKMK